jgi:uncharacterized protein (TIGR02246 family)
MRKVSIITTTLLLSTLFTTTLLAMSTTYHMACVKTNSQEIAALFDRWNNSLKTGNPNKVNENYTDKALLLPTLSNKPRVNSKDRVAYFKDFLSKHPIGKIDFRKIKIGCNKAIDTGLYTFTFKDGKEIHARYTFTYRWDGHKWLISSHHSSVSPENTK